MASLAAPVGSPGAAVISAAVARIKNATIQSGSCYDFVQAVYTDAGITAKQRKQIFIGKRVGPYAQASELKAGDWIYYDHLYAKNADHSVIFVAWISFGNRTALVIDYAGGNRPESGRYRIADLYKIWGITRPL